MISPGSIVTVVIGARQTTLVGSRLLEAGEIAKCKNIINCAVTHGQKYAILEWKHFSDGLCEVGVLVDDVRNVVI